MPTLGYILYFIKQRIQSRRQRKATRQQSENEDRQIGALIDSSLKSDVVKREQIERTAWEKDDRIQRIGELLETVPSSIPGIGVPLSKGQKEALTTWLTKCKKDGLDPGPEVFKKVETLASADQIAIRDLNAKMITPGHIVGGMVEGLRKSRELARAELQDLMKRETELSESVARKALDRRVLRASESSVKLTKLNIWLTGVVIFITLVVPVLLAAFHHEIVHWLRHLFGL